MSDYYHIWTYNPRFYSPAMEVERLTADPHTVEYPTLVYRFRLGCVEEVV
jgi:hypothetical protein